MNCKELQIKLDEFFRKVPLYSPLKIGHSVIIRIGECSFEILKEEGGFLVNQNYESNNKLLIQFKDLDSFKYIFDAKNLKEYGSRLVHLATKGKVYMDPGPFEDPMKAGFYRFIGYLKKSRGLQTYVCIVPVF